MNNEGWEAQVVVEKPHPVFHDQAGTLHDQ